MPVVSKAQNRFMHEMASNPKAAAQAGIKSSVAQDFINATPKGGVKNLPERKADGGAVCRPSCKW